MCSHLSQASQIDCVKQLGQNGRQMEELYDLSTDPFELNNLAADAAHQEPLSKFRGELARWVEATGDRGVQEEDVEEITPYAQWLEDYLNGIRQRMGVKEITAPAMYAYWAEKYDLN